MKDAYEVLYQKEADVARLRQEIESLTIAARLLAEDDLTFVYPGSAADEQKRKPSQKAISPEPTGTNGGSFVRPRSGFWGSLTLRR
jgi:hypothetical protein